jgi:hypothetical protein
MKAWADANPKRAVVVTSIVAVVALVVALGLGFLAGYKVEHDRTANEVSRLKKANGTAAKTPTTAKGVGAVGGRRAGEVTAVDAKTITVKTSKGQSQTIQLSSATVFERASAGKPSDITVGRHVLVVAPGVEVLVLGATSKNGRAVSAVTAKSFTLAPGNGLPAGEPKIAPDTVIDKVAAAKATDVKVGDRVLALGGPAPSGPLDATEVILLPSGSKFA